MRLCVLQPGYLPWLGYFDQVASADIFVHYDDAQYDKHGWRNRNRIKSPGGEPHWLTVPVYHHGKGDFRIDGAQIDSKLNWQKKHLQTLRHFYAKAPHFDMVFPELEKLLQRAWTSLVDLDLELIAFLCERLGLKTPLERSSKLDIPGERNDKLLTLCAHYGATQYLSGNAAKGYLETQRFAERGIEVVWQEYRHPTYRQLHGAFLPYLSAIDLLFNEGPNSRHFFRPQQQLS